MNILFWNLNKKDLTDVIVEIAEEYDIDLFVFCEYLLNDFKFLSALNNKNQAFEEVESFENRLKIFSTFDAQKFKPLAFSDKWGIYEVERMGYPKFIFTTVHLPSKRYFSSDSQYIEIELLNDKIKESIDKTNNNNVVLLGDFNVNPYEKGMVTTKGLHSTMDKRVALTGSREVQGKFYDFYYNPMWNFLGDESIGNVTGTYFYRNSEHISYDWNIFDQVLYSPSLINFINVKDIDIVFKTKSFNLVNNNGRIDKKYSDHLPLKFTINKNAK